jgi:hypothetical protein
LKGHGSLEKCTNKTKVEENIVVDHFLFQELNVFLVEISLLVILHR